MEKEHIPSDALNDRKSSSHTESIRDGQSSGQEDEGMWREMNTELCREKEHA